LGLPGAELVANPAAPAPLALGLDAQPSRLRRGVGLVWHAFDERLRTSGRKNPAASAASVVVASLVSYLDGKPLVVGGSSKDRQARLGRATNTFARAYKVHALWSNRPLPEAWDLTPLNTAETNLAEALLGQVVGGGPHGGYLPADAGAGGGHHYQSTFHLQSIALMSTPFGQEIYHARHRIECLFRNATTFTGGLMPLPAWVRHAARVRTCVWAKLLINAARMLRNQRLNQRIAPRQSGAASARAGSSAAPAAAPWDRPRVRLRGAVGFGGCALQQGPAGFTGCVDDERSSFQHAQHPAEVAADHHCQPRSGDPGPHQDDDHCQEQLVLGR
jgi:hypothetical protein